MKRALLLVTCSWSLACASGSGAEVSTSAAAAAASPGRPEGPCQHVVDSLVPVKGRDDVSAVARDDPELLAARAQAQTTLAHFLEVLAAPGDARDFTVKAAFAEGEIVEHMWIAAPVFEGDAFTGALDNEPADLTGFVVGQQVRVPRAELEDWLYTRDGLLHGGYTLRVMMTRMGKDRCESVLESFGVQAFGPWDP